MFLLFFFLEEAIFLFVYNRSPFHALYKKANLKLFSPLLYRALMIVLLIMSLELVYAFFSEFLAVQTTSDKMTFMYLKPRTYIEIKKYEIKNYKIDHAEEYPNRQVIIELKDGRKIKSTYAGPESDFAELIKELDKSIK